MSHDPTYDKEEIEGNIVWHVAWVMSEIENDNAPLGWSRYVFKAECLLDTFEITPRVTCMGDST